MNDLKCPRCTGEPTVTETPKGNHTLSWIAYRVICTSCGLSQDGDYSIRENAVKAWEIMEYNEVR